MPPKSNQKPRQAAWDDPNIIWPPVIPPATKLTGRGLIRELEQEEIKRLEIVRGEKVPEFRAGDVLKFHYLHSVSEGKGNEFVGVVAGRHKKRSLSGMVTILLRAAGVRTLFKIKQYSPFFVKVRLFAKSNAKLKVRL